MRAVLMFDETIGGKSFVAGTPISATTDNADTLDALVMLNRAFTVAETSVSPGQDNVQLAVADQRVRRPFRGVSLSNGIIAANAPAGTALAMIASNDPEAATLIDNAGGKIGISGRYLIATAIPILPGDSLSVRVGIGNVTRTFELVASRTPFVPAPAPIIVTNLKPSLIAKFADAYRKKERNLIVAVIGPSTSAGQTLNGGNAQAVNSWPMKCAALLQSQGIPAGAGNWFGDQGRYGLGGDISGVIGGDGRLAATGATNRAGADSAGGNPIAFTGAGTLTFTPQHAVTKFDIFYRNSGAAGQITAAVDGGATTAITAANTTPNLRKVTIDAGAAGIHALGLSWVSGTVFVIGANGYDDTNGRREITFYKWGISGATTSRFLLDANGIGNLSFTNFVGPDAIVIDDYPINDWRGSISLATARANTIAAVQQAKAITPLVIMTTPLFDGGSNGLVAQQDAYAAMIASVASEYDCVLVDKRAAWTSYAFSNAAGRYSDSVHPTAAGYDFTAFLMSYVFRLIIAMIG